MKRSFIIILVFLISGTLWANPEPDLKVVYKKIGDIELSLHFFFPKKHKFKDNAPVIVFFHGGGWRGGGVNHFYNQSAYFASRGMVAINVQYRTENSHKTTPKECVKDGKSAIRWIRSHAFKYGIDPNQIIAGGGSAGGHVAAATATIIGFNEATDDLSISCKPNALVLFNPVAHNGSEGYGFDRVKEYWKEFSPYHNLGKDAPPTLIMLGTKDNLFKPTLAKEYKSQMESLGLRCDLILYEGQNHAFFNIGINEAMHYKTMYDADVFLGSMGYLKGIPTVSKFRKNKS